MTRRGEDRAASLSPALAVETVDTVDGLTALRDEWERLFAACPHRSPFLSHAWMLNWWKHFGSGKRLLVLVLREAGRPVVIAPLMRRWSVLHRRFAPLPVILVETIANVYSNSTDFIYARLEDEHLRALWRHLCDRERWHLLRCWPVPAESPTIRAMRRLALEDGARATFTRAQVSPFIPIRGRWDEFERGLSRQFRKQLRKWVRAAPFELEVVEGPAGLATAMADAFAVAERGWAAREGTAISSTETLRGFYADLARIAAEEGGLFLCLLRTGGRAIAYEYNLRLGDTIYALKCGFDSELAELRPGNVLMRLVLEHLFGRAGEIGELNMLGEDDLYKRRWTEELRLHVRASLFRPRSLYARLAYGLQSLLLRFPAARGRVVFGSADGRDGADAEGVGVPAEAADPAASCPTSGSSDVSV